MTASKQRWKTAPAGLEPANGNVHVFCAALDLPPRRLLQLTAALSEDECERARRVRAERDRQRFLSGRGTLRELLGACARVEPAELAFAYGEFGKPRVAAPARAQVLHFNLAHSDSLALYAIADRELGVDLERIRAVDCVERIASRFFSPREEACLLALPATQRLEAFFNCWTRKEAYLKAIGRGLDDYLPQIEVSLAPGEPAELLDTPFESGRWFLQSLTPMPGFVGALATHSADSTVNCWTWGSP